MRRVTRSKTAVTIAFKNRELIRSLVASIRSFLNQTLPPDELIVVGTKDDLSGLNKYFSKDEFKTIRVIFSTVDKNEARNIGIDAVLSEYVMFVDHDMVADKELIEDCLALSGKYDAIIIPERGAGGNFWENCKRLEKKLIAYDIYTVTPRFYRASLFKEEPPFDSRFGLLDEWGFNHKLIKKKTSLGYSSKFITVKETDFSLIYEIKNKFKRGMWMRNFYEIDKKEAWTRINPIQRGVLFYIKRLHFFIKEPIYFPGLIFLKTIDFLAFMAGYLTSFFVKSKQVKIK